MTSTSPDGFWRSALSGDMHRGRAVQDTSRLPCSLISSSGAV